MPRSLTSTLTIALSGTRFLSFALLAYSLFFLAMSLGSWYTTNVLTSMRHSRGRIDLEEVTLYDFYNQVALFVALPVILAAALGGLYEALWKLRENKGEVPTGKADPGGHSVMSQIHDMIRYQLKPSIGFTRWVSVGEVATLALWGTAMVAQLSQAMTNEGSIYPEDADLCEEDPAAWCWEDQTAAPSPRQWRLRMVGIYFGYVASSHFAAILIPVSRDSKLWAALGIPFERAVLYHAIAGHLAFTSVLLHALCFIIVWVWETGWSSVIRKSIHGGFGFHGGMSIPSGWMSLLCGIPMWITSFYYIRRRWYSLFKLAHWMFIGVLVFGAMHWAPNALFYLGGLSLYLVHVCSRLTSWKRWRKWNRWLYPEIKACPTSLVNILATTNYTRLVLLNPKSKPARGGAFVYISVPGALGTNEAHAFSVALRGSPPSVELPDQVTPAQVHTLYVKSLGPWTNALRLAAKGAEVAGSPESLLVDVDGFYDHVESFNSMMFEGISRVMLMAGGSGITPFLCLLQDWAVAASEGRPVPGVRLAWVCRDLAEMELLGEAIPSILASAEKLYDSDVDISLYCSAKGMPDNLTMTWPIGKPVDNLGTTRSPWFSLYDSFRILLTGAIGWGGWLIGSSEATRRGVMDTYHQGGTTLAIMIVIMLGGLLILSGISGLISARASRRATSAKVGGKNMAFDNDFEAAANAHTFDVMNGRIPVDAMFAHEAEMAKTNGTRKVKVLVCGPNPLVESVFANSRSTDWRLFETEALAFEF